MVAKEQGGSFQSPAPSLEAACFLDGAEGRVEDVGTRSPPPAGPGRRVSEGRGGRAHFSVGSLFFSGGLGGGAGRGGARGPAGGRAGGLTGAACSSRPASAVHPRWVIKEQESISPCSADLPSLAPYWLEDRT